MKNNVKPRVQTTIENGIATIKLDDGDKNLISPQMLRELNHGLDQAEQAGAVVVITGRDNIFSAGFDLKVLKTGVLDTFEMLMGGFGLSLRLLSFPTPVVIACNGHAIAMGSFMLLSGDYRIGVEGDFKIVANEVAIGLTMPYSAVEICRQRLKPAYFDRAVLLSETFKPATALDAGFFDAVVPQSQLESHVMKLARQLTELDLTAHRLSKLRMRKKMLTTLKRALLQDRLDFVFKGIKRVLKRR